MVSRRIPNFSRGVTACKRHVVLTNRSCRVTRHGIELAMAGGVTNETRMACDATVTMTRTFDEADRLICLTIPEFRYEMRLGYSTNGLIASVSNSDAFVTYTYSDDMRDVGCAIAFADGGTFTRTVTRDPFRRDLILSVTNSCGTHSHGIGYAYDALSRPATRNGDTFCYNGRSEVIGAIIDGSSELHEYDDIGNSTLAAYNFITNIYTANNVNQYTSILCASAPRREPAYDADGNMTFDGVLDYSYDVENRLVSISSNGITIVTNQYDHKGRRIRKTTPIAVTTFLYDDWNLIYEHEVIGTVANETFYYWGKDISGTLQGAGGIGGLLYLKRNGTIYVPHYDAYGNVVRYADTVGNIVATYTYGAFGNRLSAIGPLVDVFRHRFSTKYHDAETGLYYYGCRFYDPNFMRWLNRDPIEEYGGNNLYGAFKNQPTWYFDPIGLEVFIVWHMPGDDLLYEWSKPDSAAETHFRASKPSVKKVPCGSGKTAYKVTLTPPVSMLDVYFRCYLSPQQHFLARKFEEEHVKLYVAYDKCIEEFKRRVESICACQSDAEKQKKDAEDWLEGKARYYKSKNEFLDRKGGPHGH